jgi:hypothetical protein
MNKSYTFSPSWRLNGGSGTALLFALPLTSRDKSRPKDAFIAVHLHYIIQRMHGGVLQHQYVNCP